jgi:hypothetical protein
MKTAVSLIILSVGFLSLGYGLANWRSFGRGFVVGGVLQIALAAYFLLKQIGSQAQYAALGLLAILVVSAFINAGPTVWRAMRLELSLATGAIFGILLSTFWTDAPVIARQAIVVGVGLLTASFIAVTFARFGRSFLKARRA